MWFIIYIYVIFFCTSLSKFNVESDVGFIDMHVFFSCVPFIFNLCFLFNRSNNDNDTIYFFLFFYIFSLDI